MNLQAGGVRGASSCFPQGGGPGVSLGRVRTVQAQVPSMQLLPHPHPLCIPDPEAAAWPARFPTLGPLLQLKVNTLLHPG